ncbi:MAG: aspartate aminotransferase family protein [Deltaproteobacteria bacterium]|nr:aspartate aminotransferase family protein [Deltaproteobacteria bacterium]
MKSALLSAFKQIDVEPSRGEGMWLFTEDGDRYLDFYGGHAVALLGNCHPRLTKVLSNQAHTLFFQTNLVPLAIRERAAQRLASFAPQGLANVFFVNSGAEANENALRVSFRATGRKKVAAVAGAFHGRTAAAATITAGHEKWYGFPQKPFEVDFIPFDDINELNNILNSDTAALIFEPVQGVAGARAMSQEFINAARKITSERGIVLIFDEVQCGLGRTGWPFAAQAYGVTPDIITTAKGIAGGFPAGAMLCNDELAKTVTPGALGTTFGGGPLACALIEAVIDTIEELNLLPNVRRLSERIKNEAVVGPITKVQGMGFLLGLHTNIPAAEVLTALRSKKILAGGAADPNIVRLLPPLILEDAHVDALIAALTDI